MIVIQYYTTNNTIMTNDFEIKNIKYYNGNKNFIIEVHTKPQNDIKTFHLTSDDKIISTLDLLEKRSTENHSSVNIVLITNSFYENSLNLLKMLKKYPKLFGNTIYIDVCITTFLIMGWSGLTEIPNHVKEAFKSFYIEARKIGFELQNYRGDIKLVCDKQIHLLSEFL